MTTTSPDSIRTPNNSDAYNLVADLATMAADVQAALVKRANSYIGTSTQRLAFTTAPNGSLWQDTNGNKGLYRKDGASWVSVDVKQYGTAAERNAVTPTFGQLWTDSDGSRQTWKGASGGTWRRRSGRISVAAGAWDAVSGSDAGRTITVNIPTVLEAGESVLVAQLTGGGFFSFVSQISVGASSGGVTPVTIRQMQIFNVSATNAFTLAWELVDLPTD